MVEAEDSMAAAVSAVRRGIQFWVAVMLTGVGTGVSAGALCVQCSQQSRQRGVDR
jgi:hypothetical protein